jgi:hypothetical protein
MLFDLAWRQGVTVVAIALCLPLLYGIQSAATASTAFSAWDTLQNQGYVVLLRRVETSGDDQTPSGDSEKCADLKVLSEIGEARARRIGDAFRMRNVPVDLVYTSQWCSAEDTALLLDLADIKPFPALNSFAGQADRKDAQMTALKPWVSNATPDGIWILVTHQEVITALVDLVTSEGEMIVVKPLGGGEIEVIGRIEPF